MAFIVFVAPALLAGLLGVFAHQAGAGDEYLPRLRVMLLGAAALGYLGPAVFVWRRQRGWRRVGALLLGLAAVRILYLPAVAVSLVLAGWLEWGARRLGAAAPGLPVHYGFACLTAASATLGFLWAVAAATRIRRPMAIVSLLALAGLGTLVFWAPADRTVSPHPFAAEGPMPATQGPRYLEVVEDGRYDPRARILAAFDGIRHVVSPRSGWAGVVREELHARFRGNPALTLSDRVTSLEAALRVARAKLAPPPAPEQAPEQAPGGSGG